MSLAADDLEEAVERLDRMSPPSAAVALMEEEREKLEQLLKVLNLIPIKSRYIHVFRRLGTAL